MRVWRTDFVLWVQKGISYLVIFVVVSFIIWVAYMVHGGRDAAILMYHSVGEVLPQDKTINVSVEAFQQQMAFLKKHHYHVIPLLEVVELLKTGQKIPPKTVVITFDDGYENNYTLVFPILKRYQLPATIFIISRFIGQEEQMYGRRVKFMTTAMVKEIADSGIVTIGSHTQHHLFLPKVSDPRMLEDEIIGSKKDLEGLLNKPVLTFCYPIGGYNPQVQEVVKNAGYKVAVTTFHKKSGSFNDIFALKRIKVTEEARNPLLFFLETSGYFLRMKKIGR